MLKELIINALNLHIGGNGGILKRAAARRFLGWCESEIEFWSLVTRSIYSARNSIVRNESGGKSDLFKALALLKDWNEQKKLQDLPFFMSEPA